MSKADHLGAYAEGWITGDGDKLMSALADEYVLDDPNHGRVAKADMAAYFEGMKAIVRELRGGKDGPQLLELTEVLTGEEDGILTAWCWWTAPGTDIAGGGLIQVSDNGVVSERLTYYTALSG
jgi:hypothetical protein